MLKWNQFSELLGVSEMSIEFIGLISSFNEQPIVTEDPDEYNDAEGKTKYYSFPNLGLLFGIRSGILNHVLFYIEEHEGYKSYKGELVNGINGSFTDQMLVARFGTPDKMGGGNSDILLGYIYKWMRFNIGKHKLRFEFTDKGVMREVLLIN